MEVRQGSGPWLPVDVYPVKVDRVDEKGHNVEVASIAYFDFDGMVDVRVISNKERVNSVRVRPLSYKITPDCVGDTVTFSLSRPRNLSVEVNGDIFHNLHLFANPIDKFRPSDKEIQRALKKKKGTNLIILVPVCIIFLMILYLSLRNYCLYRWGSSCLWQYIHGRST